MEEEAEPPASWFTNADTPDRVPENALGGKFMESVSPYSISPPIFHYFKRKTKGCSVRPETPTGPSKYLAKQPTELEHEAFNTALFNGIA